MPPAPRIPGVQPFEKSKFAKEGGTVGEARNYAEEVKGFAFQEIERIQSDPSYAFDTDAAVGLLRDAYDSSRQQTINTMMAEARRAQFEMDAHFASAGSDPRSSVRFTQSQNILAEITGKAYEAIYANNVAFAEKAVDTMLGGAQVNIQGLSAKAGAIAGMLNSYTEAFGVYADTYIKDYANRITAWSTLVDAQTKIRVAYKDQIVGGQLSGGYRLNPTYIAGMGMV